MTLLQLSLRAMLWILFAAAIAIGWGWERWGRLTELAELQKQNSALASALGPAGPSHWSLALKQLAETSDEELRSGFVDIRDVVYGANHPYFTEMARRGMTSDLQAELDALEKAPDRPRVNAEVFTALRRAERKPDPVQIDVRFVDRDSEGKPHPVLHVEGFVRNADVDREPIRISWGGDYRGGRRDRWRVELRDEQGERIPDSNFVSWEGGGRGGESELKFGETSRYTAIMDPRRYAVPPRSGRYQLQLLHCEIDISHEPDLDGLIVWKSAPIWVDVVNRESDVFDFTLIRLGLVISLAIVVVLVTRFFSPPRAEEVSFFARWGDLAACFLIIALAIGWWFDGRQLRESIAAAKPHSEADWTIVAPQEKAGESGGPKDKTEK